MVVVNDKIFDNFPQEEEEFCLSYYLVDEIILHNYFNEKNLQNNIGLVKVEWAFEGVRNMAKFPPYPAAVIGMVQMLEY